MPITWKTVATPQISDPTYGMSKAQEAMASGFNQINKVVTDRQAQQRTNWQGTQDFNTSAHLDQIAQMQLQGFDAQEQVLRDSITGNMNIDRDKIRKAYDQQETALRTQETTEATYAAKKPIEEIKVAIQNMKGGDATAYKKVSDLMTQYAPELTRAGQSSMINELYNNAMVAESTRHKARKVKELTFDTSGDADRLQGAVTAAEKAHAVGAEQVAQLEQGAWSVKSVLEEVNAANSGWSRGSEWNDFNVDTNAKFITEEVGAIRDWLNSDKNTKNIQINDNELWGLAALAIKGVGVGGKGTLTGNNDFSQSGDLFEKSIMSNIQRYAREKAGADIITRAKSDFSAFKTARAHDIASINDGTQDYVSLANREKEGEEKLRERIGNGGGTGAPPPTPKVNLNTLEAIATTAQEEIPKQQADEALAAKGIIDTSTIENDQAIQDAVSGVGAKLQAEQEAGPIAGTAEYNEQFMTDIVKWHNRYKTNRESKAFETEAEQIVKDFEATNASPALLAGVQDVLSSENLSEDQKRAAILRISEDAGIPSNKIKMLQKLADSENTTNIDKKKTLSDAVKELENNRTQA